MTSYRSDLVTILAASLVAAGCASGDGAEEDPQPAGQEGERTTEKKDDMLYERADLDGDGSADIVEQYKTWTDEDNPDLERKRLVKKKVDVNTDGEFDIVRTYDDQGNLEMERSDNNLDGSLDAISYFNQDGDLVRKEIMDASGKNVVKTRYYTGGKIDRVEKDENDDGETDYWEYYSGGKLERIGHDENADGEIDRWVHRRRESTTTADPEAETSAETGTGGEPEGSGAETGSTDDDGGDSEE